MRSLIIKKSTLVIVAALVLAAAGIISAACASSAVHTAASNGMTVVIDPGHGGADGGVVGTDTGEKGAGINLGISPSPRHFLREAGFTVVMARG